MSKVFHAYDIRGEFGGDFETQVSPELARRVGAYLPRLTGARRALIGHDPRQSAPEISAALKEGFLAAGCDVDDVGLATTPEIYWLTAEKGYEVSVQVTASHNPPAHIGMKISLERARPMGADTGLKELEALCSKPPTFPRESHAQARNCPEFLAEYAAFLKSQVRDFSSLRFAVDCSNGSSSILAREIFPSAIFLNDVPDGRFPNHSPNPLLPEARAELAAAVRENALDLGVIFDGDADRVMFVDEVGAFVRPDVMIAIIASLLAADGESVLQDIRTSRGVTEALEKLGAKPAMWKVGHAFAKEKLRELNAVCGGELAGHYYFRDFHFCDSGFLAAIHVLRAAEIAKQNGKKFSELIAPIDKYANSGEINFTIENKDAALAAIDAAFPAPLERRSFDGIRLDFEDFWFNVRKSNTEPYLRLVAEAETPARLSEVLERLNAIITK